jgi:hypothetical protein
MGLFSKKEDTKHIKEFDVALSNLNTLARKFRVLHFESLGHFGKNFEVQKTPEQLQKERVVFEAHLDVLQQLKLESDRLMSEAFKLVRDETLLTEQDRAEIQKLIAPPRVPTGLKLSSKKSR